VAYLIHGLGYMLDTQGIIIDSWQEQQMLSILWCPDWLWGPHNLLFSGYCVPFPIGKAARAQSWPLTLI